MKFPFLEVFKTFSNLTTSLVLAYLIVSFLIMVTFSWRWKIVSNSMGFDISYWNLFCYRVLGYGVSYLTPAAKIGGEPVRAALMKKNGLSFSEGSSTVIVDKTLEITVALLFFIFGVTVSLIDLAIPKGLAALLLFFSIALLFVLIIFVNKLLRGEPVFTHLFHFLKLHKYTFLSVVQSKIRTFEQPIVKFYHQERDDFYKATSLTVVTLLLSLLEYRIVLAMLGIEVVTIKSVFLVFMIAGISFLIPIPMALGTFEAFQAGLFTYIALGSAAAGVGVAVITRFRDLLWVLVASIILLSMGGNIRKYVEQAYEDRFFVSVGVLREGKVKNIHIPLKRKKEKKRKKWEF